MAQPFQTSLSYPGYVRFRERAPLFERLIFSLVWMATGTPRLF